jgi:hypothetical protein
MGFAGAAWNVHPIIQVLLPTLTFHFHNSDTKLQMMAACHLGTFKKVVHSLKGYYKSDPSVDKALSQTSYYQIFPYKTHFASLSDSSTQHFEYISQPISHKPLFFGKLSSTTP